MRSGATRARGVNAIDWIAIAGSVTTALAALFTGWQAREVRRTVGEQREDRRLLYRPYLDVQLNQSDPATIDAANIGRGVALSCIVFSWVPAPREEQGASLAFALGAGNSKRIVLWQLNERADFVFAPLRVTSERIDIAICVDELGVLHRFGPNSYHEECRPDASSRPAWTRYQELIHRLGA